jgi:CHAT domain-containing protein
MKRSIHCIKALQFLTCIVLSFQFFSISVNAQAVSTTPKGSRPNVIVLPTQVALSSANHWLSVGVADLITQTLYEQRAWTAIQNQSVNSLIAQFCPNLEFECLASSQLQQKTQSIGRALGADLIVESRLVKRGAGVVLELRANQSKWLSNPLQVDRSKSQTVRGNWANEVTLAVNKLLLTLDTKASPALYRTTDGNAKIDTAHIAFRTDIRQWTAHSNQLRLDWLTGLKGESIALDSNSSQSEQTTVSPIINNRTGWSALIAGNAALAETAFKEGLKKARVGSYLSTELSVGQAVLEGATGEAEKSNRTLNRLLTETPSLIEIYALLANNLSAQSKDNPNKKTELLKFANQWGSFLVSTGLKTPETIESSNALGKWLYETVDDDDATVSWMNQATGLIEKTVASLGSMRTSDAAPFSELTKEQQARLSEAYLLLARAQLSLKQTDLSIASLNKSLSFSIAGRGEINARTAVVLLKLNEALLAKGDPQTALGFLQRALISRERALGLKHPDTLYTAANLGFAFTQLKQFENAIAPLARAIADAQSLSQSNSSSQEKPAVKPEDYSIWLYNLAASYRNLKRWPEAAQTWGQLSERFRPEAQKSPENLQEFFDALDEQADALLAAKNYTKALPVLKEVLIFREQFVSNKDQELRSAQKSLDSSAAGKAQTQKLAKDLENRNANVATTLLDIVRCLDGLAQVGRAEPYAERAYNIRVAIYGAEHRLVDLASQWWASALTANDQNEEALARVLVLRQAQLAYGLKNADLKPADKMQRFSAVATAYRKTKQFKQALAISDQAKSFATDAIAQIDKTATANEKQTARRLLADLALVQGEIERDENQTTLALESFSKSVSLYESSLGLRDPDTQHARETYAQYLDLSGQKLRALEQWQLVLNAVQSRQPKFEFEESRIQIELGSLQVATAGPDTRKAEVGLSLIRQAIATRERLFGVQSNEVSIAYNNYGVAFDVLGRSEQAIAQYEKTLAIALKSRGPDDRGTLITASNLAFAIAPSQPSRALTMARDTLERRQKILPAAHPETLNSMAVLAQANFANGDYLGAAKLHETTALLYDSAGPQTRVDAANNRIEQGRSLLQLGRYSESLGVFEKLLQSISKQPLNGEAVAPNLFEAQIINALDGIAQAKLALGQINTDVKNRTDLLDRSTKQYGENSTFVAIARRKLAEAYANVGEYASALKEIKTAVQLCEQLAGSTHPTTLAARAIEVRILGLNGDDAQALNVAQQVLDGQLKLRGNKHPDVAAAYNNLANANFNLGRFSVSAEWFEKALEVGRNLHGEDHPETLIQLSNFAFALDRVGQYQRALELQQQVLTKRRAIFGDHHPTIAQSQESLIDTLDSLGRYPESLKLARENYAFRVKLLGPEHPDTLRSMQTLAEQMQIQDDYLGAEKILSARLDIAIRTLGENHPITLTSFSSLARATARSGNIEQAVAIGQRGLNLAVARYGRNSINTTGLLIGLANRLSDQGRYDLEAPLREEIYTTQLARYGNEHPTMAAELSSYAAFKNRLGRADLALKAHEQALAIRKNTLGVNHPDYALSLSNVAIMHAQLDDYQKARDLLEEALVIYRRVYGDKSTFTASIVGDLGTMIRLQGQPQVALPLVQETVTVNESVFGPTHPNISSALNALAVTQEAAGQRDTAIVSYQRALVLTNDNLNPELRARILSNLSNVYANNGNLELSIFFGKLSVNLAQTLRSRLIDLDQKTQRGYVENKDLIYKNLANRLIDSGRIAEAQQVLDMLKEQELYDFIRRDANTDPRQSKLSFSGPEQQFVTQLNQVWTQIAQSDNAVALLTTQDQLANAGKIDQERQISATARAQLSTTLQRIATQLPESQRQLAEQAKRDQTESTAKTQGVIATLGDRVALVHYLMLGNKLRIIVTSAGQQTVDDVNISERDLNRLIIAARRAIENPRTNPLPAAQALNAVLIAPIAQRIANTSALMLALDSTLRYVPFSALHDGNRYLVETHQLALYTAASKDSIATKPQPKWQVAGLGMTQAALGFSALPGVREELNSIVGGDQTLTGEIHFDTAFTAQRMQSSLKNRFPVMHIASHFKFNPGTETESFLLLGDGTKLSLRDIRVGDYSFSGLDLLTLSACETAMLGGRDDTGREVEGFGALAQNKGARSVLATLWPIADRSTALLMRDLYYQREQQGIHKSQALRRAQLGLLNGQLAIEVKQNDERGATRVTAMSSANAAAANSFTPNPRAPFAHPYYWAPFILMGNPL